MKQAREHWFILADSIAASSLFALLMFVASVSLGCSGAIGSPSSQNPPAPSPPSIVSFTANPTSIQPGGSATLSWVVTGANSISINQGVGTVTGTSVTVSPTATTTYTLTATNSKGSQTAQTTVTVVAALPVIQSFSASPTSIQPGGSATLSWVVTGANSISINQGVGTVTGTSVTVTPTATTTYTLTATNSSGSQTAQTTVTVGVTASQFVQGKPQIVSTQYSTWDVPVVRYNVAAPPYSADATGVADATAAIQHALNDCASTGGGTVYLPSGDYKLLGVLNIPTGITLRGDWSEPSSSNYTVKGTVLDIYAGQGNASGTAAITLGDGAGIRDLSVFYPQQNVANPVLYPFTIRGAGSTQTVLNITLVNSYQGLDWNATPPPATAEPYIRNVYGVALAKGFILNGAAAIPRVEGLYLSPAYWANSGLPGAPSTEAISQAMRALPSIGIQFANSANAIMSQVALDSFDTGILFNDIGHGTSNGKAISISVTNARVGMEVDSISVQGWSITDCTIQATGAQATAVMLNSNQMQFNRCTFSSTGALINQPSAAGGSSFVSSNFSSWGSGAGVDVSGGNVVVMGSSFGTPPAGQPQVSLSATTSAVVFGNTYNSPANIVGTPSANQIIDTTTPYTLATIPFTGYTYAPRPRPARQDSASLFNVRDYGAAGDAVNDDTAAFQTALQAAGNYGGGTVYVPGGAYRINGNLTVPSGVELRGPNDTPFYSNQAQAVLLSYADQGVATGTAFLSLSQSSGVRGLLFYRPEQTYNATTNITTIYPYPPMIRALGSNAWAIEVSLSNAYFGIDFGQPGTGGHFLDWVSSAPIQQVLSISADGAPSVIENMQTNPDFWLSVHQFPWSTYVTDPSTLSSLLAGPSVVPDFQNLFPRGTAVSTQGDGNFSFYSSFFNNPYNGFVIVGNAPTVVSIASGGEGQDFYNLQASGAALLRIVGNSYHPITTSTPEPTSFGNYQLSSANAQVQVLNSISYGTPTNAGYLATGGTVVIQEAYQTVPMSTFASASGAAKLLIEGSYLRAAITLDLQATGGASGTIAGTLTSGPATSSGNVTVVDSPH